MTATATAQDFRLPDVGEGLTEADVVTWHVAVGDVVEENQVLVDIETAKSVVELPSPYAGTVLAILVTEGETAAVGTPLVRIGSPDGADGAEEPPAASPTGGRGASGASRETPEPKLLVGYGSRPETPARRRPRAKPPVRRLAAEHDVELASVTPTGPDGVVTREDVEQHLAPTAVPRRMPSDGADGDGGDGGVAERIPVTGVRKHTAAAMVGSAFTAPHASLTTTVDVTATVELRERLRRRPEFAEVALSPFALVARAYVRSLLRTPMAHARWEETAEGAEIVVPRHVHLGVAAATDRGLVVPVVRRAETLDLPDLAVAIAGLTATARAGRTPPEAMTGGTTTITNVGVFGVDGGTPILNPGQTSILAVGAIRRRPWVVAGSDGEERLEPRSVLQLSLSFDHRVMDGAEAARLLADVGDLLTDPALAL